MKSAKNWASVVLTLSLVLMCYGGWVLFSSSNSFLIDLPKVIFFGIAAAAFIGAVVTIIEPFESPAVTAPAVTAPAVTAPAVTAPAATEGSSERPEE